MYFVCASGNYKEVSPTQYTMVALKEVTNGLGVTSRRTARSIKKLSSEAIRKLELRQIYCEVLADRLLPMRCE